MTTNSWLLVGQIPQQLVDYGRTNFDELFKAHPQERANILMYVRPTDSESKRTWRTEQKDRWMKSYLQTPPLLQANETQRSYMFAGVPPNPTDSSSAVPLEFQPFVEWMMRTNPRYNQVIINWYDAEDHIPFHSDCELHTIDDHAVSIISLYENQLETRPMLLKRKGNGSEVTSVELLHGSILFMCGAIQKEYRHRVPPGNCRRISISFRQMKDTTTS